MARLNLRPIYDRDELTGGERIAQGIGGAIDAYATHQEQGRAEESRRRAAGQVMTTRGEGAVDRLRSLGRRLTGRNANTNPERIIPASGIVDETLPPDNPVLGTSTAPSATPVPPAPIMPRQGGVSMGGRPVIPARNNPMPVVASSAVAPQPSPLTPHTIGNAIDKYTEDDNFGNQWTVDPNYAANRALTASRAELQQKDEFSEQGTRRSVDALTAAGMPRAEAEARVRTNTVRYDTEFGQQPRGGSSQADKLSFEELRQKNRKEIAQLSASGRLTSQEIARRRLELDEDERNWRRDHAEDNARASDVDRDVKIGGLLNSEVKPDPYGLMSPEDKAKQERTARERDRRVTSASQGADRLKNSHATREQAQARARALRAAGKSPAEIAATMTAEGYKVH